MYGYNEPGGISQIVSSYSLINDSATVIITYTISNSGTIKVDFVLTPLPGLPNIPKVGMQAGIKDDYKTITWYGRGPYENYIDRNYGSDAGIYNQSINKFIEPYVMPQENANRTDVRWMHLSNQKQGLLIVADSLLSMSAWPYTEAALSNAKHTNQLVNGKYITLNIDLIQMGVGGNDTWSDVSAPLDQYQIPAKRYAYSFYILPQTVGKQSISSTAQRMKF